MADKIGAKGEELVSIVIRNRNEGASLREVLKSLAAQTYQNLQIVIVDNRSTDDSTKIAGEFAAEMISIDDFTYGKALNQGIARAKGEVIVVLSAHSVPLGRSFLTECVSALEDPTIAAARLIYSGKRSDVNRWIDPEILTSPSEDFVSKGPLASGCVIRRSVWERYPFDETVLAAEDKIWGEQVLRAGYSIVSPIPAYYYYNKELSPVAELYKNYKELVAIKLEFGKTLGFVSIKRGQAVLRFVKGLGYASYSFVKTIRYEMLRAYLSLRFPRL